MLKGHLEIELKDEKTGEVVKHKEDNMVTNAMAKLLGIASVAGAMNSSNSYYKLLNYLLPIAQKGLGGLLLFDGTLEESEDNIHFPMDVSLTGCAGREANTSSKLIGSYNSTESHRNDNGFTSVWDFTTSQANGTIASLSLTNYMFAKNPFDTMFQEEGGFATNSSYQPIAYNPNTDIAYFYYYGKIYSKKTYSHILRVNTPDLGNEEEVFDFSFSNPSYSSWSVCNGYDGYIYAIYYPSQNSKGTVKIQVRKIKISDFSFTDEGTQTISIDNITASGTNDTSYYLKFTACVSKGYLFFKSYDGSILYKVNLSNTVDIKELTFDNEIKFAYLYPRYNGGLHVNVSFKGYTSSGSEKRYYALGWLDNNGKLYYNESSTYDNSSDMYNYCGYEGDNLQMFPHYSFNYGVGIKYGFARNYLGTICNLSSPVVKTSTQTMKVTYTLTDE